MNCRATALLGAALFVTRHTLLCAQTVTFMPVGTIAGPADLVKVNGGYAYLAAGKTLTIVDVTDATAPKRAGTYTFPELIWGFTVVGSTVYVAADTSGLAILDTSNPAAPVLRGALKTPGQTKNVAIFGTKALVADHVSGIDMVDVSTPARPVIGGSFFVDGFAKDVVTRGTMAFALDQPAGLYVFDLTKPGAFEPAAMIALANPIQLRAQLDVTPESSTAGQRLAVVAGGGPLQIYDVSNPRAMVHLGNYRTAGAAQRTSLQGTRVYVADGAAGLQVVDLSSPSKPAAIGSYKTSAPARDVAVDGPLVFVVVGNESVLILRQVS
jgi:hypothetical protein